MKNIWYKILMRERFLTKFVDDKFSKQSKFLRFTVIFNLISVAFSITTGSYFLMLINLSVIMMLWFPMNNLYKSLQPYER